MQCLFVALCIAVEKRKNAKCELDGLYHRHRRRRTASSIFDVWKLFFSFPFSCGSLMRMCLESGSSRAAATGGGSSSNTMYEYEMRERALRRNEFNFVVYVTFYE